MESEDAARLQKDLSGIISVTGIYIHFSASTTEPSSYNAPHATIVLRRGLDKAFEILAVLHELCHAALHPPKCDDLADETYWLEEQAVHYAASEICLNYGITDYMAIMTNLGAPIRPREELPHEWQDKSNLIVNRLTAALHEPTSALEWSAVA